MAGAGQSRVLAIEKLTGMSDYNSWAHNLLNISRIFLKYGHFKKILEIFNKVRQETCMKRYIPVDRPRQANERFSLRMDNETLY
jgi:hypothetical protein